MLDRLLLVRSRPLPSAPNELLTLGVARELLLIFNLVYGSGPVPPRAKLRLFLSDKSVVAICPPMHVPYIIVGGVILGPEMHLMQGGKHARIQTDRRCLP